MQRSDVGFKWLGVFSLLIAFDARADLFHYNNLLIGDRAIGLGGAYTAIADDSAGVYYNPAGIAFAGSNDVSGSANAFVQKSQVYKKAIGNENFTETTGGSVPSFFGGLQKLDTVMRGLVFAFGVYFTDSELKNQNTLIDKDINLGAVSGIRVDSSGTVLKDSTGASQLSGYCYNSTTKVKGDKRPDLVLQRYRRTMNERGSTMYAGGSLGYRPLNNLAIGLGANYVAVTDLIQVYQDERNTTSLCNATGTVIPTSNQLGQNIYQDLNAMGVQLVLGMQLAFLSRFSLGLTVKGGSFLKQSLDFALEKRVVQLTTADQATVDTNSATAQYSSVTFGNVLEYNDTAKLKKPLGSMPGELRLGLAYFASTRLLISSDISYIQGVNDNDLLSGSDLFGKQAVLNESVGIEYYVLPAFPLRVGYFTNHDATPSIDRNLANQRDHIDYQGASAFIAWVQPNSQIGIGAAAQSGTGEAQKIGGYAIQKITGQAITLAFSATHSF